MPTVVATESTFALNQPQKGAGYQLHTHTSIYEELTTELAGSQIPGMSWNAPSIPKPLEGFHMGLALFGGKLVRRLVLGVLGFRLLEFWPKLLGIRLLEAYEKASEIAT